MKIDRQILNSKKNRCLLWLLFFLIFIDLLYQIASFPAKNINQDNYYYISLGMLPQYCGITELKDAFTVGIFPILLFRLVSWLSWGAGDYFTTSLVLSKLTVFLCIAWFSFLCLFSGGVQKISLGRTLLLAMMFLGFRQLPDLLSLNAEYIAVTLIITVHCLINLSLKEGHKLVGFIVLSLICINTKFQSLPILFVVVLISNLPKKNTTLYCLVLSMLILINECFLYINQIGYFYNYESILGYINSSSGGLKYNGNIARDIYKFILKEFHLFPLALLAFAYPISNLFCKKFRIEDGKLIFLLSISIFVGILPLKFFDHYSVYLMIPLQYFISNYDSKNYLINHYIPKSIYFFKNRNGNFKLHTPLILILLLIVNYGREDWRQVKFFATQDSIINWVYPYKDGGMDDFRKLSGISNKSRVFVNGWDYSIPPYLKVCPAKEDFASMHGGLINAREFYSQVYSKKYDFILDIVGYSGIVNEEKYLLKNDNSFQDMNVKQYNANSFGNQFSVYKIK